MVPLLAELRRLHRRGERGRGAAREGVATDHELNLLEVAEADPGHARGHLRPTARGPAPGKPRSSELIPRVSIK